MLDAHAGLAWVRDEIASLAAELQPALPSEDTLLCEFLRDGRALCLLTTALTSSSSNDDNNQEPGLDDKAALPKNLQRSLHQVTTFHALERVQFFIKWCRTTAALDAHFVFSSVQLLDEQNDKVVCACLDALRTKYRPHLKSSGLWVQKSASNLLTEAKPAALVAHDESDNQSCHDNDATTVVSSSTEQETAVPATAAPVATPAPALVSNKLNAFLSKFPSETNVLAPVAVAPVASAAAVAAVAEQEVASDDSDDDNNAEEPVETYEDTDGDIDDDDDSAAPQPRAPHLSAFSPRSSLSRSSIGSSLSFSFTSDPRHHESFTDEQHQQMNLSFSSVLSSPPASPKPATRLRIPSIFERSTAEKKSESSSSSVTTTTTTTTASATDLRSSASSATSSTKDEATPRKLQIPSAFAAGSAATPSAVETPAPAIATDVSAAAVSEPTALKTVSKLNIPAAFARSSSTSTTSNTSEKASTVVTAKTEASAVAAVIETAAVVESVASVVAPEPAAPKPVSKLSIPAAFSRSTSTSTSSNTSEKAAVVIKTSGVAETVVETAAAVESVTSVAVSEPAVHKTVSKLSIPPAFARSTSTSTSSNTSERLSLEKSETASSSVEPASPLPASVLTRKPSRLKIPSVFAAAASSSALDVSAPVAKPVEPVVEVAVAAPIETVAVPIETTDSVEKESVAASPAVDAPTTPTAAAAARTVPRSPFAAFVGSAVSTGPPSISRSTSNSSTTPASKLAAFLSTVEVASAFALPTTQSTETAKATAEPVSFSDDESDSDGDDDNDKDAERVSVSQETAIGLPSDDAVAPSEEPSAVVVSDAQDEADVASRSSSNARVSIDQFDERLSENSAADAAEHSAERASESSDDSSDDEDAHNKSETVTVTETTAIDEVEVEQHSIEHHDHADSEQPFFVVEEVSLSKPATSSKLYAFLHSVDSAQTHRFSHSSATDDALDAHVETAHVERTVGSVRSASTSSRHSSAHDPPAHKEPVDESTTSEHSDHSPRASVTSLKFVASADVILEKERLSGENLALQLKLQTATDALAAKDVAVAALQTELEELKAQLAAANAAAVTQAAAAEKTLTDRLAAKDAVNREELAAVERSRDEALEAKTAAEAQVAHLTLTHATDASKLAALVEENDTLTQELQRAKDSEEAARYSAQVAFAARDEAEERLRSQQ